MRRGKYEKAAEQAGWMQTPSYGPLGGQWWRSASEDDTDATTFASFGGGPVVWADTAKAACERDKLDY